jgi:two-component system, CAI-1 autoinducer sensor kinase/phosphatase CqsS
MVSPVELCRRFSEKNRFGYSIFQKNLFSLGWIGALGHPLYWYIWTYLIPQPYESFYFRFICAAICVPLMFHERIPESLNKWKPLYWYATVTLVLPAIFTFLLLMNDFSRIYMTCQVMLIFLLVTFLPGIALVTVSLATGVFIGCFLYWITAPAGHVLTNVGTLIEFSPLLLFALVAGSIFSGSFKESIELTQMRIAAQEQEKSLKALAGSIAHEMRNPLGQIRFSLHSMRSLLPRPIAHVEPDTAPPTVSPADLNAIYRHLAQGETSINRGLQIIGMTLNEVSGKPIDRASFEYLSASKAASKAVEEYSFDSPGERDKVTLEVRKDFTIKVNETAYIFILFNLIKNALYYFKQYPQATLLITVNAPCVTVRDTGPGIAPEMLNKLFGSFVSAGKAGGTGLGLAYCQRTMQAFGGDIVCNSVLGSYTEFTLLFPPISEAEIQLEEHKVMSQAVPFFDGKRVLVVDDQPFVRQSTCRALEGIATRVDEAEDGAQAITKLRLGIYDLVVMDLDMPVLDGYAAAEQIRQGAAPGHEEVAIVAYTAESAYVAQVKTEKVGMNGFVSKPCSQTELLRTLQAGMQAAAEATRLKGAARRLVGKRVLVADDCAFNRKITVAYLRTMGIQSVEAQNGQEALDLACMDERFDAALLDMEMPVMNGVQTARALRSAETGGRRLPLIALTAHLCDTHMTQALEAGMDGFVSKPFSDAHLRTTLLKVLPPERAASGANGPSKS